MASSVPSSFNMTVPGDLSVSPHGRIPAAWLGAGGMAAAAAVLAAGDGPLTTHCCWLASLKTTVEIETRMSPGICALSPGNEISWGLTSLEKNNI